MIDMKNIIRNIIGILAACALLAGCKGGEEKKAAPGPEAVVETFTRLIATGEFEQALGLCDTTSMKAYIDNCREVREKLEKKDSSALAIASSILAEAEFKVERTEKTDIGRNVYYTIEVEGQSRQKMAELGKEEGEWRIGKITDAI